MPRCCVCFLLPSGSPSIKYQTSQFTQNWRHPGEKASVASVGEALSEPVRLLTEAPAILRANLTALVTGEPPSEIVELEE